MKNLSQGQLDTLVHMDDAGERIMGPEVGVGGPAVVSNKDLLHLERKTSVLEKRLLVCTANGENLVDASRPKRRERPAIQPVPESSVLGRIKSFLPSLDLANRKLFADIEARGADDFNIESITEPDERYVQMDLALGVADLYTSEALAAAELAASGQALKLGEPGDSSDSSSSGSDSEDDESCSGRNDISELLEVTRSKGSRQISGPDQQECKNDKSQVKRKRIEPL